MKLVWLLTVLLVQTALCAKENDILEQVDGKIVGGKPTNIKDANYQVAVLIFYRRAFEHLCGGSIITENHIVSAAHCFYGLINDLFAIRAGSNYSSSGGQFISASSIALHPYFNIDTVNNDIAVVRLSSSLVFDANVQPVKLPLFGAADNFNTLGLVSGWGLTRFNGKPSKSLQSVNIPLVPWKTCKSVYTELTSNMFCAGDIKNGGKDSCQGDSGGPFVQNKVLTGIVSWGFECAKKGFPGVYTKVSSYRLWIDSQILI